MTLRTSKSWACPSTAAAIHPSHSGRDLIPVDFDHPIDMAGVHVQSGDIILADDEGVIAMPLDLAEYIAVHGPPKELWRPGFAARSWQAAPSTITTRRPRRRSPNTG